MATVYLGRDLKLDRQVAIKVMRPELVLSSGVERFLREVQTVATLNHPHILALYESGEADGFPYFVMPFIEGESLRQRLDREKVLPAAEAVRLAGEIAEALAYADQRGIVHRDIKPGNIMLHAGHALVSDFGIAKATDAAGGSRPRPALTETGQSIGTPLYMSPEQVGGGSIDGRSDIYALGCMLFEMLEGAPPYDGPTPTAVLVQHSVAPIPPLVHSRDSVAPGVEAAVRRAMAKAPDDRFTSAAQFQAALKGGATLEVPRVTPRKATPKTALLATGIAVLLVAGYLLWSRWAAASVGVPSIAVLAFSNLGGDSANEPFSDGVSDEITTMLGRVPGLQVAARSLAHGYKGGSLGSVDIGKRLHVRYVLDGGVRIGGTHRRVSVQLTDVGTGIEVWSADYNHDFQNPDVFAIQDSIASRVVGSLGIYLSAQARTALASRVTNNPAAHDLYLKGRYYWGRRDDGPASLQRAIDYFHEAIALDSNYALAWAGLADAWSLIPAFGERGAAEPFANAKAAALRALMLDTTLAEVHTSLGIIATYHDWDWTTAGREFDQALALDSTEAHTHLFRAWYFLFQNHADRTLAELRTAHRLDPGSRVISTRLAEMLGTLGNVKESEAALDTLLAHDSTNAAARGSLGLRLARQKRLAEAFALFDPVNDSTHWNLQAGLALAGAMVAVYARNGRRPDALRIQRYLERRATIRYVSPTVLSSIARMMGDTSGALTWLERAYEEREFFLPYAIHYSSMVAEPRVQRIAKAMDLPFATPPAAKLK